MPAQPQPSRMMWIDPILRTPVSGGRSGNAGHLAPDINALPFVDRRFLTQHPHLEAGRWEANMVGARGCPYDCSFCGAAVSANPDITIRTRDPHNILAEMYQLRDAGVTAFRFVDSPGGDPGAHHLRPTRRHRGGSPIRPGGHRPTNELRPQPSTWPTPARPARLGQLRSPMSRGATGSGGTATARRSRGRGGNIWRWPTRRATYRRRRRQS